MMRIHRPWRGLLCAAALVVILVGCAGAAASPSDVIADFNNDGLVDGQTDADPEIDVRHTLSDLVHAKGLMAVQQPGSLAQFLATDQAAIDRSLLGIEAAKPAIPTGQPSVPQVDMPAWAVATGWGAGLLALGGVGSAFYRRARRGVA